MFAYPEVILLLLDSLLSRTASLSRKELLPFLISDLHFFSLGTNSSASELMGAAGAVRDALCAKAGNQQAQDGAQDGSRLPLVQVGRPGRAGGVLKSVPGRPGLVGEGGWLQSGASSGVWPQGVRTQMLLAACCLERTQEGVRSAAPGGGQLVHMCALGRCRARPGRAGGLE